VIKFKNEKVEELDFNEKHVFSQPKFTVYTFIFDRAIVTIALVIRNFLRSSEGASYILIF